MNIELTRERGGGLTADPLALDGDTEGGDDGLTRSRRGLPPALRAGGSAWIWIGVAVAVVGFLLITVGWGQVAGETQVYLQVPYVVSAALVGLGLVLVGLTVLNIASRQRDGADRDRRITQLVTIMEELKEALEERDRR